MSFLIDAANAIGQESGQWDTSYLDDNGDLICSKMHDEESEENGSPVIRSIAKPYELNEDELSLIKLKSISIEDMSKSNAYKKLRLAEYAKLNQNELMFDDQQNGTTTWVDAINAIKLKYPKPS